MRKILKQVTVTGADDSIDPKELVDLATKYPFVEFGILCSKNNTGTPRFPSEIWMNKLLLLKTTNMYLCMHLCGTWVRDVCEKDGQIFFNDWIYKYLNLFKRIQLNYRGLTRIPTIQLQYSLFGNFKRPIIFPIHGTSDELTDIHNLNQRFPLYALYDSSGGKGISKQTWLKPVGNYCGYSGGFSKDNIRNNLEKLSGIIGDTPIWVDFETYARTEDNLKFDIHNKVIPFLEIAKDYVI